MKELGALNALAAGAGSSGVVIGVAVGERRDAIADFARERGLRYLQLVDEDFAFADALGEGSIPATLVLDRDGHVVFRGRALDPESIRAFERALDAPAAAAASGPRG